MPLHIFPSWFNSSDIVQGQIVPFMELTTGSKRCYRRVNCGVKSIKITHNVCTICTSMHV